MNADFIFLPVLAQVLLTLSVFLRLARAKSKAAAAGQVNEERRALYDDAWPDSVIQVNNNIRNQSELPLLFYVLCFILWALGTTNVLVHAFAWLFVASRVVHVVIHTGSNYVPLRRRVFAFGFFMVSALLVSALASILLPHVT